MSAVTLREREAGNATHGTPPAKVPDTLGAGDVFHCTYIYDYFATLQAP